MDEIPPKTKLALKLALLKRIFRTFDRYVFDFLLLILQLRGYSLVNREWCHHDLFNNIGFFLSLMRLIFKIFGSDKMQFV